MDSLPTTNRAKGDPISTKNTVLTTGASLVQDFKPVKHICAHLNAFHAYASDPSRCVETNHYCAHLNEDVRQCILYDSPEPNARLIGIEYMITPHLYETLPTEERKLWHSHVFEVKSGMLIMPNPSPLPDAAWDQAEGAEMEMVVGLYGKIFHLWQTDRGDALPMGLPQLMTSFTSEEQMAAMGGFEKVVGERDERLGGDWRRKREGRAYIEEPVVHEDADVMWKK
ncbi:hypothetical protein BLS_005974 [Venturia inaequalis]|uniref:DUF1264-domain-containing protein n=1 Tax=Venturia inaequalis TaxID=5025 RepID=A0A8H3Z5I4_VENIN|nr:hypothetical protein BLS_005974 [Venturia inaequalis]KAE9976432.1 hypothetical protein EG327_008034 [Venturia inaequalis]KAE9981372.1 hypothetical protein EG328_011722 [Venturia inaequalis]RDI78227.1 hypothetical protein Vi05172_g11728 [Venturia inaequalis]